MSRRLRRQARLLLAGYLVVAPFFWTVAWFWYRAGLTFQAGVFAGMALGWALWMAPQGVRWYLGFTRAGRAT